MASPSGVQNGTLICLYIGGIKMANLVSNDLDLSTAVRDTTNKDNAGYKTVMAGVNSWACSAESMFDETVAYSWAQIHAVWLARALVTVMVSSQVTGDKKYTGQALLTSAKRAHPMEANATYTVSFEGSGPLVEATI